MDAMRAKQQERFDKASGIALKTTIGADAGFAMLQDAMAQATLMEAGAQEQYSKTQTAFSSLLGGVAGATQLGFGKFRGVSGLGQSEDTLEGDVAESVPVTHQYYLRKLAKKLPSKFLKDVEDWNKKVEKRI